MVRNFKELQTKMDSVRRTRVETRVKEALKAIPVVWDSKNESKQPSPSR